MSSGGPTGNQNPVPAQSLAAAIGVQFETFPSLVCTNFTAPSTQVVYGLLIGVTPGAVITGVKLRNSVAASGTSPTAARFGIATSAGVMLAQSANLNTAASWPAGVITAPLAATYTVPVGTTVLFAVFVVNGTWGTTQPTPAFTIGTGSFSQADGTNAPPAFQWTAQTDLPANGNSLTITGTGRNYYMALY